MLISGGVSRLFDTELGNPVCTGSSFYFHKSSETGGKFMSEKAGCQCKGDHTALLFGLYLLQILSEEKQHIYRAPERGVL